MKNCFNYLKQNEKIYNNWFLIDWKFTCYDRWYLDGIELNVKERYDFEFKNYNTLFVH